LIPAEHIALVNGEIKDNPVFVRVHSQCLNRRCIFFFALLIAVRNCGRRSELIGKEGGVISFTCARKAEASV